MGHNQLNILVLKSRSINLLSIILVILFLVVASLDGLALTVVVGVVVTRVVVAGVVVGLLSSELLSSGCLGLGVEILDLGLAEDTLSKVSWIYWRQLSYGLHIGVAGWGLVNLRLVDDEEDLKRA